MTKLEQSTDRLRIRNEVLASHLGKDSSMVERIADSPESTLEDATERARKYWDSLELKRSSVPPKGMP